MSRIGVHGWGAVSPAGWGLGPFRDALKSGEAVRAQPLERPCCPPLQVRTVPPPVPRPAFLAHPRLRRTSPISHYTVAAALEALGDDAARISARQMRLGIVLCVTCGCVNYSRRFYAEALRDPTIASPLLFPETVFNAPASHLATFLGSGEINYTIAGDQGVYLQGLALAADWLALDKVDGCLVIGAEEMDWLTGTAATLFDPDVEVSEGSGSLYLKRFDAGTMPGVELHSITDVFLYGHAQSKARAAQRCREQLAVTPEDDLLCDGLTGCARTDREEKRAWGEWSRSRVSPKRVLGEGFTAGAAWQCVAMADALRNGAASSGLVSVVGANQQAVAARFVRGNVGK